MPDLSWVTAGPNLRPLVQASVACAGWQSEMSWQTAGVEVEGAYTAVLVPFTRPVPLAVSDPLAILGQYTGSTQPAGAEETNEEAASAVQRPPTPRRPLHPQPKLPAGATPDATRSANLPQPPAGAPALTTAGRAGLHSPVSEAGLPVTPDLAPNRRPLPAQAPAVAKATWLRALAGDVPEAASSTAASPGAAPATRAPATIAGPALREAIQGARLPLPDPAAALSLLAELARPATQPATPRQDSLPEEENLDATVSPRAAAIAGASPHVTPRPQAIGAGAPVPVAPGREAARPSSPLTSPLRPAAFIRRALQAPLQTELRLPQNELAAILQGGLPATATASPAGRETTPAGAETSVPLNTPGSPLRETGLALLRRTLPGPQPRPAAPQAAPDAATPPELPAPPLPAVQNTFNVQVHMEGSPADEEALAARLNRILVEQARRYGIDV